MSAPVLDPHAALLDLVDERTLRILQRRRSSARPRRRGWLVRRMLLLADVLGLVLAFFLADWFAGDAASDPARELLLFAVCVPLWIVAAKLHGLYDGDEERADHSTVDEFFSVFNLLTLGTWLFFVSMRVANLMEPRLSRLILFWGAGVLSVVLARAGARGYCRRQIEYLQNTIVVGAGDVGQLVARKLIQHREYGINLVGFVDAEPKAPMAGIEHVPLLGPPASLTQLVDLFDVERVVFAFSNDSHEELLHLIRELREFDVQVDIVPRLFEVIGPTVGMHTVEGMALVGLPRLALSRSSLFLKRIVDLTLAGAGLFALAPLLLAVAGAVKLTSRGPVFFRQVRMGYKNRPFEMFKFRTMVVDAEARKQDILHLNKHLDGDPRMFKAANDPRITRVGRLLRRYSLDELPQLLNVIRGEMSMVGPRPLVLDEDEFVLAWGRERLSLKPGVTGPWQVLGASEIPFEEMVKLDYLYVTGWSLVNDLKIVLQTVPAIFRSRSAY